VAAFRAALGQRLPVSPSHAAQIRARLDADAPEELSCLTARADALRRHEFDLLGSGSVDLGSTIDWHADFKSGYRWPSDVHYGRIVLEPARGVDVKIPWELYRCQHVLVLAQAYAMTGRNDYAAEAAAQILDWTVSNPPEFGVNWTCAMEVAIRAVNWLWAAALLSTAPAVGDDFFEAILASFLAHGRHIVRNLEIMPDGRRTNHYIADLVGLLYIGLCVRELDEAVAWATFAQSELREEMNRQVLGDGFNYESSLAYHRLATEMFASAALLARHHGRPFDRAFLNRLEAMVDCTAAYTKPNGLAPQAGDGDDGRLHILSGYGGVDPRDHRHILALGACLFDRDDWRALAGPRWVEALWMDERTVPAATPPTTAVSRQSAAFPDAGVYVLRSGEDFVLFTAGPVGSDGLGNHKHNDVLAIEVHFAGEDILVDPGTYAYTSDPAARNGFRSTAAHNTVSIDGVEQNRFPGQSVFALHADATPRLVTWCPSPDGGKVVAEHDGYCRLSAPVVHRRSVSLDAGSRVFVEDTVAHAVSAIAAHRLAWTFAFAPGCTVTRRDGGWLIVTPCGRRATLTDPTDPSGTILPMTFTSETGSVSPRYGVRVEAPVVRWMCDSTLPLSVRFSVEASRQ